VDDERRRIVDLPSVIECKDDSAAIEYARHLGSGRLVEIWDRHRCVGIVTRDGRAMSV
jgi:hypothetical protein